MYFTFFRYSGDYSMSSSTTSISHKRPKEIQPRYLDISKYKSENSPKNFLRRDPSKTYVGVLNDRSVSKGSAQHYEMGKFIFSVSYLFFKFFFTSHIVYFIL